LGIAPEMLPRVFDLFSQAEPEAEISRQGLGIGLSLVKGLVEVSGGTVEARSDGPGKGSEFIVRLPVVVGPAAAISALPGGEEEVVDVARRRIVIVDDLKDSADSLAMFLKVMGHEVHIAYDGEDAILAAERLTPDVVLLDLGMPKMNGYEACRRIRQQPWGRRMLLVAMTGWGQEDDRRRTLEAGFDHHLVKPVEPREILRLLASLSEERAGRVE
jgi:CheY-like chemotaxis protein